uniref:Fibronectin type-III domain-containing protein n=1 Tax=Rhabditophanes sp. KR3021 TaxID=114890 RepID=A0AC35TIT6_9BILA
MFHKKNRFSSTQLLLGQLLLIGTCVNYEVEAAGTNGSPEGNKTIPGAPINTSVSQMSIVRNTFQFKINNLDRPTVEYDFRFDDLPYKAAFTNLVDVAPTPSNTYKLTCSKMSDNALAGNVMSAFEKESLTALDKTWKGASATNITISGSKVYFGFHYCKHGLDHQLFYIFPAMSKTTEYVQTVKVKKGTPLILICPADFNNKPFGLSFKFESKHETLSTDIGHGVSATFKAIPFVTFVDFQTSTIECGTFSSVGMVEGERTSLFSYALVGDGDANYPIKTPEEIVNTVTTVAAKWQDYWYAIVPDVEPKNKQVLVKKYTGKVYANSILMKLGQVYEQPSVQYFTDHFTVQQMKKVHFEVHRASTVEAAPEILRSEKTQDFDEVKWEVDTVFLNKAIEELSVDQFPYKCQPRFGELTQDSQKQLYSDYFKYFGEVGYVQLPPLVSPDASHGKLTEKFKLTDFAEKPQDSEKFLGLYYCGMRPTEAQHFLGRTGNKFKIRKSLPEVESTVSFILFSKNTETAISKVYTPDEKVFFFSCLEKPHNEIMKLTSMEYKVGLDKSRERSDNHYCINQFKKMGVIKDTPYEKFGFYLKADAEAPSTCLPLAMKCSYELLKSKSWYNITWSTPHREADVTEWYSYEATIEKSTIAKITEIGRQVNDIFVDEVGVENKKKLSDAFSKINTQTMEAAKDLLKNKEQLMEECTKVRPIGQKSILGFYVTAIVLILCAIFEIYVLCWRRKRRGQILAKLFCFDLGNGDKTTKNDKSTTKDASKTKGRDSKSTTKGSKTATKASKANKK